MQILKIPWLGHRSMYYGYPGDNDLKSGGEEGGGGEKKGKEINQESKNVIN